MCHTKASLRLPLNIPTPSAANASTTNTIDDDFVNTLPNDVNSSSLTSDIAHNNLILPTPSCTGSMDSLSSSSGSDRHINFSTFGKSTSFDENNRINECDGLMKPATLILIENENILDIDHTMTNITTTAVPMMMTIKGSNGSTKQSDSTDEDSGIESIMRIAKEKNV